MGVASILVVGCRHPLESSIDSTIDPSAGGGGAGGGCSAGEMPCGDGCAAPGGMVESNHHLWRDCDESATNACEIDTFGDVNNCGGCGRVCNIDNAVQKCVEPGYCAFVECLPGFVDCDKSMFTGCEAHPIDDPSNCGACGVACPTAPHASPVCASGDCAKWVCDAGRYDCNGVEDDGCESAIACD